MAATSGPVTADVMAEVARVVAEGDRRRLAAANRALATLRPYERRLVREAAVMGYVLALPYNARCPRDADILRMVLEHCATTADLYPYLGEASQGRRRRVTRKRMWPGEHTAASEHDGEDPS